jgi:hypothetical protein
MSSKIPVAIAVLASVFAHLAQPASSAHRVRNHRVTRHAPAARQPTQIACTVIGCMPIPAACTPIEGKTPGGIPTGFDVIACPPGTWPLK